jgi:hypothetical protein
MPEPPTPHVAVIAIDDRASRDRRSDPRSFPVATTATVEAYRAPPNHSCPQT